MTDSSTAAKEPDMAGQITQRIATYRPKKIDDDVWDSVGPMLQERVTLAKPLSPGMATRLLSAGAGLCVWAAAEHIPLDVEKIFSDETIERYVSEGLNAKPGGSSATIRSRLRRLARPATRNRTATIARSDIRPPYTPSEIRLLRRTVAAQRVAVRRRRLSALMALAAGCGCNATDVRYVRGVDVVRTVAGGLQIAVGGPRARTVFCLAGYEDDLAAAVEAVGDGPLVGGNGSSGRTSLASDLAALMQAGPDLPKLNVGRLRATWMVTMLSARVPFAALLKTAGVVSARSFVELLNAVPDINPDAVAEMFRHAGLEHA